MVSWIQSLVLKLIDLIYGVGVTFKKFHSLRLFSLPPLMVGRVVLAFCGFCWMPPSSELGSIGWFGSSARDARRAFSIDIGSLLPLCAARCALNGGVTNLMRWAVQWLYQRQTRTTQASSIAC